MGYVKLERRGEGSKTTVVRDSFAKMVLDPVRVEIDGRDNGAVVELAGDISYPMYVCL